jgi:hypothetical protein
MGSCVNASIRVAGVAGFNLGWVGSFMLASLIFMSRVNVAPDRSRPRYRSSLRTHSLRVVFTFSAKQAFD